MASKHRDPNYIPRPPNSWILYVKEKAAELKRYNPDAKNLDWAALSKIISSQWRRESQKVKAIWRAKAALGKIAHQAKYPNYRFQPRKSLTNLAKEGAQTDATKASVSEATFTRDAQSGQSSAPISPQGQCATDVVSDSNNTRIPTFIDSGSSTMATGTAGALYNNLYPASHGDPLSSDYRGGSSGGYGYKYGGQTAHTDVALVEDYTSARSYYFENMSMGMSDSAPQHPDGLGEAVEVYAGFADQPTERPSYGTSQSSQKFSSTWSQYYQYSNMPHNSVLNASVYYPSMTSATDSVYNGSSLAADSTIHPRNMPFSPCKISAVVDESYRESSHEGASVSQNDDTSLAFDRQYTNEPENEMNSTDSGLDHSKELQEFSMNFSFPYQPSTTVPTLYGDFSGDVNVSVGSVDSPPFHVSYSDATGSTGHHQHPQFISDPAIHFELEYQPFGAKGHEHGFHSTHDDQDSEAASCEPN